MRVIGTYAASAGMANRQCSAATPSRSCAVAVSPSSDQRLSWRINFQPRSRSRSSTGAVLTRLRIWFSVWVRSVDALLRTTRSRGDPTPPKRFAKRRRAVITFVH